MRSRRSTTVGAVLAALLLTIPACTASGSGPTGTPPGSASSGTVPAASRDVTFDADGTKTYGTLEIPAHRDGRHLAAALLLPGSGPTDRDGNDKSLGLTAGTLRLVADLLAEQGIMTLRYDKYFAGKTGAGRFALNPGAMTMQDQITQARDAYDFLAKQPQADPAALLVVGHSEGGMVALSIATSTHPAPAGLALLEPQDIRILDLVQIQVDEALDDLVSQGTLSTATARTNAQLVATAITTFRAGRAPDTKGMAPQVIQLIASVLLTPNNAKFGRSNDKIVPARLAAEVKAGTRVLVTDSTADRNIPPSTIGPLVQALTAAGTTGPGLTLFHGLDHLMHLPSQPDGQAVLAPAAVKAIWQWARPYALAK